MPRFTKDGLTIETAIPREAAELRAQGFSEQKARTDAVKQAEALAAAKRVAATKPDAAAKPDTPKSTSN